MSKDLLKPLGESKTIGEENLISSQGLFQIYESSYICKGHYFIRIVKLDEKLNIIGSLQLGFSSKRSKKATISLIYVKDSCRRLGIASLLLNYAKRFYSVKHSKDLTKEGRAWKESF